MKILLNEELNKDELKGVVLTLGNFDGLHLGHQRVLKRVVERARVLNTRSMVFTFEPHPMKVIAPHKDILLITTLNERKGLISKFGIHILYIAHFNDNFARQHADEFIKDILIDKIEPQEIIVGYDYTFGRGKKGGISLLQEWGDKVGFRVEVIPPFKLEGRLVSSSMIRETILNGDVREASKFLGRFYSIRGGVIKGAGRGKVLGFPTANISSRKELIPKRGVYATYVFVEGNIYRGIANIGFNPTFGKTTSLLNIEVYLFNFNNDLYGKEIELFFVDRIRDEMTFETPLSLTEQIQEDIREAKEVFKAVAHVNRLVTPFTMPQFLVKDGK